MNSFYLTPLSLVIVLFLLIGILVVAYFLFSATNKKPTGTLYNKYGKPGERGVCPICGTVLAKDESMISSVYPGEDDRLCYIYGCPHCYPIEEDDIHRSCPVCKTKLDGSGHLIARYFDRRDSSKRIHILGCTKCRLKNK